MDLTDEALVENFRMTKDSTPFKSLVRRYQNRIFNAAFRILGNAEEAEEVVQDTFMKVHLNLDKYRAQSSFSSWVFAISHNLCMDTVRNKLRKGPVQMLSFDPQSHFAEEEGTENPGQIVTQLADPGPGPTYQVDLAEEEKMIQDSLMRLPDTQRAVLVLHDIEGFSYQEIADIIGTSIGTVRSRLHYGRQKLKELLDPYYSAQGVTSASR